MDRSAPQYEIEEYVVRATVMSRKQRILVEGVTDYHAVVQVLIEEHGANWHRIIDVDTAEMLRSPPATSLGNREKVEEVFTILGGAQHVSGMVDREYRYYAPSTFEDTLEAAYVFKQHLFWTTGHSIESSLLTLAVTEGVIKQHFPHIFVSHLIDKLKLEHPHILRDCAALCLAGYELGQLGILKGDRGRDFDELWHTEGNRISLSISGLMKVCETRSVDEARSSAICKRFSELKHQLLDADEKHLQGLCHGHIGVQLYWAGVAYLVQDLLGSSMVRIRDIATFGNDSSPWRHTSMNILASNRILAEEAIPYLLRACRLMS